MGIECTTCRGTVFFKQDGRFICEICLTESQEHGFEVVINEETLGIHSTMGSQIRTKSIKSSSSKKSKRSQNTSFTSLDAFSFILRGWILEVENLEIVSSSILLPLVKTLWIRYLQRCKRAFVRSPSLGLYPSFRDLQVTLTNRKIISRKTDLKKWKTKREKEDKKTMSDEELAPDDTSFRARRKRRKRRRDFFGSVADSSSLKDSTINSSFVSDTETHDNGDSSDGEIREIQNYALERLMTMNSKATNDKNNNFSNYLLNPFERLQKLTKLHTFAIFAMGLLWYNESSLSSSDISWLVDSNGVSYYESIINIPTQCQLVGREDRFPFLTFRQQRPLGSFGLRTIIHNMGSYLDLGTVTLCSNLIPFTERYLKEFCLPNKLVKIMKVGFKHTSLLKPLTFHFSSSNLKSYAQRIGIPDVAVRVLALLLIVLKYLYGLDDASEYIYSHNARQFKNRFVFSDWLKLSRIRAFLLCKFVPIFHRRFSKSLFQRSEMSHSTFVTDLREQEESFTARDYNKLSARCRLSKNQKRQSLDELEDFLYSLYNESLPKSKNIFAFRETLTPMSDFVDSVLNSSVFDNENENENEISEELKNKLRQLSTYSYTQIGLQYFDPNGETLCWEPKYKMSFIASKTQDTHLLQSLNVETKKTTEIILNASKTYKFDKYYWMSQIQSKTSHLGKSLGQTKHSEDLNVKISADVPDNYGWLLKYFSSYADISIYELHAEVCYCEKLILDQDPSFFGEIIADSTSKTRLNSFQVDEIIQSTLFDSLNPII